ncbi:M24 family metallopeptidase [Naasia lichenicola]|nr:M24 family metallopeptidase [Naasia lichenicola]
MGLIAAQDLAREIVRRVEPLIVEGVTELELERDVLRLGRELGSDAPWTTPTTRIGIGTTVCHPAFPMQDRAAVLGDTVIIDVNPVLDGWLGDYCESFVVGADSEADALVAAVREIQLAMIELVVPGMPASELYAIGAALVAERNLKVLDLLDNFGHSQDSAFAAHGFIDSTNHAPMWGGWTVEPQLGRHGRGAKFEEIIWLAPGRSPVVV